MFSTVILYEPVYNIISLQQAIRRVWRLGQKDEVVVKALVYPGMEEFAWEVIAKGISWAMSVYGDFTSSSLGQMEDQSLDLLAALTEQLRNEDEEPAQQRADAAEFNLAGIAEDHMIQRRQQEVEVIDGAAAVLDAGDEEATADEDDVVDTEAADDSPAAQEPAEPAEVPTEFADLPLFKHAARNGGSGDNNTTGDTVAEASQPPAVPAEPAEEPVQLSLFAA